MTRPLLAALALALATVVGPVAGVSAVAPAQGPVDEGHAQGWGPRVPGWLEPAPRGRVWASGGDAPRALPRRSWRLRTPPAPRRRRVVAAEVARVARPDLNLLGRRQTDGG
jgi:hypothetical protein